jgi:hypothetical protein
MQFIAIEACALKGVYRGQSHSIIKILDQSRRGTSRNRFDMPKALTPPKKNDAVGIRQEDCLVVFDRLVAVQKPRTRDELFILASILDFLHQSIHGTCPERRKRVSSYLFLS